MEFVSKVTWTACYSALKNNMLQCSAEFGEISVHLMNNKSVGLLFLKEWEKKKIKISQEKLISATSHLDVSSLFILVLNSHHSIIFFY